MSERKELEARFQRAMAFARGEIDISLAELQEENAILQARYDKQLAEINELVAMMPSWMQKFMEDTREVTDSNLLMAMAMRATKDRFGDI